MPTWPSDGLGFGHLFYPSKLSVRRIVSNLSLGPSLNPTLRHRVRRTFNKSEDRTMNQPLNVARRF